MGVDGLSKLAASFSNLGLSAVYLLTWAGMLPPVAGTSVRGLAYLILTEFVLLMLGLPLVMFLVGPLKGEILQRKHRGPFFACSGVIAAFLVISGLSLSASAGAVWPLLAVATLLAGKITLYFRPPQTHLESLQIMADAVLRLSALFFLLLPCVLIPLPSLGLPARMEEFPDIRPAGLMVWGALYFALFGLFGHRLDAMVEQSHRETPASAAEKTPDRP